MPETVTISVDTAIKHFVFAGAVERYGIDEGDDDLLFLGRDCAEQILEAIRQQCGESTVSEAVHLLNRTLE